MPFTLIRGQFHVAGYSPTAIPSGSNRTISNFLSVWRISRRV